MYLLPLNPKDNMTNFKREKTDFTCFLKFDNQIH